MLHSHFGRIGFREPGAQGFRAGLGCGDLLHFVDERLAHRLQGFIGQPRRDLVLRWSCLRSAVNAPVGIGGGMRLGACGNRSQ